MFVVAERGGAKRIINLLEELESSSNLSVSTYSQCATFDAKPRAVNS